ncbi:MAG: sugar phosphate isomerase/epimerase family protein [Chloroflexota bacterium]
MRIGTEGDHIAEAKTRGAIGALQFAIDQGIDGVFFKSILDLSPTLDPGELQNVRDFADAHDLYLEVGAGRVNPYNTAESPYVRELGGGDYRLGFEKLIRAAHSIGCTELWAETGTFKRNLPRYFVFDRFRTDVTWEDQLAATERFLRSLTPLLRDLGCRINVETHEEITSFEAVRLVEAVGPDTVGITFDTANVLARGEDPVAAARRVAPYTHTSHIKDAILTFVEDGLERQVRACGEGVIDWDAVIGILAQHKPDLNLSIEGSKTLMRIQVFDRGWQAGHPDLSVAELAELARLAKDCENRIARGEIQAKDAYQAVPESEQRIPSLQASVRHLREILDRRGLARASGKGAR